MILLLTHDLMMTSNVSIVARQQGFPFRSVRTVVKAIEMLEQNEVSTLLIDLQTPALDPQELATALTNLESSLKPRTIAYAQHVYPDLLKEARTQGFDQVLTRGQFSEQMAVLLA